MSASAVLQSPLNSKPSSAKTETSRQLMSLLGPDVCYHVLDQLGIVSVTDIKGRILHANDEFIRISGYSRDELIGKTHQVVNSSHHPKEFFREMYRTIGRGQTWRAPIRNRRKDGSYYWVDALIVPLKDAHQRVTGYLSVRLDITAAVTMHLSLFDHDRLLQGILDNFPGGIAVYDKTLRMRVYNARFKELLEYPDELFEKGLPSLEELLRFNARRGEYGEGDIEELVSKRLALAQLNTPHSYERARPNGTYLEVRGAPLEQGGFVSTHLDVTERKRDQEIIERLAQHDALTGLGNRRMLHERMQQALERVKRGDMAALLYLDLDRFKAVNDTLGHPIGDLLLQNVANRLVRESRSTDTVVRLGGDEFAILQVGIKTHHDAADLAQRIIREVSAPYSIGEHAISIGTSVGISVAPNDTNDPDHLLRDADLALYQVKTTGRGTFRFFEKEMDTRMRERHAIESGLREALQRCQLSLHYQPIVSTSDRRIVSCEALLRWHHPQRGLIPASQFVPIAEETGLIEPIGNWVLKEACQEARQWPQDISISVNVSPAQFRNKDLKKVISHALDGLDPARLILEITESTLMQKDKATLDLLEQVRELGVRFALDDFGTGYSSLSYLHNFRFDKIKIDRSFITSSAGHKRSKALLSAIAGLGRTLEMTTVAEGVETEEQFRYVREQGCTEAQGHLFSSAIPGKAFKQLLKEKDIQAADEDELHRIFCEDLVLSVSA